jgi:hypothetical protein
MLEWKKSNPTEHGQKDPLDVIIEIELKVGRWFRFADVGDLQIPKNWRMTALFAVSLL